MINDHFVPVKIHIKEQPQTFERFGAQWTPTFIVFDPEGHERRRFEGFLPAPELLGQLELGLGQVAFAHQRWDEAERRFRRVVDAYHDSDAAPEALYWAGVSKYKAGRTESLAETARRFQEEFQDSVWAKKASVWAA